jgi:hypothetical protein
VANSSSTTNQLGWERSSGKERCVAGGRGGNCSDARDIRRKCREITKMIVFESAREGGPLPPSSSAGFPTLLIMSSSSIASVIENLLALISSIVASSDPAGVEDEATLLPRDLPPSAMVPRSPICRGKARKAEGPTSVFLTMTFLDSSPQPRRSPRREAGRQPVLV